MKHTFNNNELKSKVRFQQFHFTTQFISLDNLPVSIFVYCFFCTLSLNFAYFSGWTCLFQYYTRRYHVLNLLDNSCYNVNQFERMHECIPKDQIASRKKEVKSANLVFQCSDVSDFDVYT